MASIDEFTREQLILSALKNDGRVTVSALAAEFGVSSVTVRKDLVLLENRNLLRRVRGGAVATQAADEGAFEMRLRHSESVKRGIATAAAALVDDGDVIAIDSSTTTYYLAQELLHRRNLVVITNGLRHAMLFMEQSSAMVMMPGGVIRRSASSVVGPIGDVLAGRGRIDAGFFGVAGISTSLGLLDISSDEAQTKRAMATACDHVYALFDSSKFTGFGLHSFADPGDITAMVTDTDADPTTVRQWSDSGVDVTQVPAAAQSGAAAGPSPAVRSPEPDGRRRPRRGHPTV